MKILGLYNNPCAVELFEQIEAAGHEVITTTERLDLSWVLAQHFDLAVSYTYRYIVSAEIIAALSGNIVNIHNSFLPFNRGADPNLWSIIDDTPKGVTIHYMDAALDKGYIIAQEMVDFTGEDTLHSSYYKLDSAAKELFMKTLEHYESWGELKKKALGQGSYHSVKDGLSYKEMIDSYDMKISDFRKLLGIGKHSR